MVTNQHTGLLRAIPGQVCLGVPQTHSKSLLLNLAKTLDSPWKVLGIHLHVCLCLMHLTDSDLLFATGVLPAILPLHRRAASTQAPTVAAVCGSRMAVGIGLQSGSAGVRGQDQIKHSLGNQSSCFRLCAFPSLLVAHQP